jgi:hypothetical protein
MCAASIETIRYYASFTIIRLYGEGEFLKIKEILESNGFVFDNAGIKKIVNEGYDCLIVFRSNIYDCPDGKKFYWLVSKYSLMSPLINYFPALKEYLDSNRCLNLKTKIT